MAKTEKSPKGTKTKKIKDKLLLFIVPAVVVTIIILVAISSFLSKSRLEEMARNELESSPNFAEATHRYYLPGW